MSMAQIGEFAFVLLSRASNLHLVEVSMKKVFHCVIVGRSAASCSCYKRNALDAIAVAMAIVFLTSLKFWSLHAWTS